MKDKLCNFATQALRNSIIGYRGWG